MIQLRDIHKRYGQHKVLSDVNLTVNKGDVYGLIGKNGAGKTTIFKIILGLTEYSSGSMQIIDSNSTSSLQKNRKKIGFFIGHNFFDYLTAYDNLKYHCTLKGIKDAKKEIDRVLTIVNLKDVKKPYKSYSMGMKQRLGIANAIIGQPEILILDEPTNGLDPQGILDIRHLVKRLNEEFDMTIIISSHILGELEQVVNTFGIVHNGTVLKEFSQENLKQDHTTIELKVSDYNNAKAVLKANNIQILDVKHNHNMLEQVYFEIVGDNHE